MSLYSRLKKLQTELAPARGNPQEVIQQWQAASGEARKHINLPKGITAEFIEEYGAENILMPAFRGPLIILHDKRSIHYRLDRLSQAKDRDKAQRELFPHSEEPHEIKEGLLPETWGSILTSMGSEHRELVLQEQQIFLKRHPAGPGENLFDAAHRLLHWCSTYGTPAVLPPIVAGVFLKSSDARITHSCECEDCGYQLPIKGNIQGPGQQALFSVCPLCGGGTGYQAYSQKHGKSIVHLGGLWEARQ